MILTNEIAEWETQRFSVSMCKMLSKQHTLVVSPTWASVDKIAPMIQTWLDTDTSHDVIVFNTYDPAFLFKPLQNRLNSDRVKYVSTESICFWLLAVDKFFLKYSFEDVAPTDFKNDFLCYQRKACNKRVSLFDKLKDKNGIVTIGTQEFPDINSDIPDHSGMNEVGGDLFINNDNYSLGNIDVWNQSFLNIVSETRQDFTSEYLFVSEKIFKPMIGLRPFICFGHPKTTEFLNSLGFETFDEEFNYHPTSDWENNIEQISQIADNIDTTIFNKLIPKLIHNKNLLAEITEKEWEKLRYMAYGER